jgi:hypothetical protein
MRKFSPTVTRLLSEGVYSGFYLLELDVGNPVVRQTTLPYDVTLDQVAYSSDTDLIKLDPPKLSNTADREAFKLTFSDPELKYAPLCDSMINAPVTVFGGFYNTTGADLPVSLGPPVSPNDPVLNSKDLLIIYSGFVDTVRYAINEENGVILEIECASPMASLDALNVFYTTQNSLRQRVPSSEWSNAADTSFDNVSLGGRSQEILWGKI